MPPNQPQRPKYEQLLQGRFGRNLIVAEVATLVGTGVLYYKLTTDANSRAKMEKYVPWVMSAFHEVTGGKYRDDTAAGAEGAGAGADGEGRGESR